MQITATPQCGGNGYVGWVMANPGRPVTVWGDTHCTGVNDGWITIDTSKQGWALYDSDGNYLGQRGWNEPKRTYEAIELQIDRAWDDKWEFNASYTWSRSQGNAEGPVNSDTEFDDTGRTENFDDPWVNFFSGDLPNDRRHQFKARGTYRADPALALRRQSGPRLRYTNHRIWRRQPVRCHQLRQLFHLQAELRRTLAGTCLSGLTARGLRTHAVDLYDRRQRRVPDAARFPRASCR